jgi:hypothetical protein
MTSVSDRISLDALKEDCYIPSLTVKEIEDFINNIHIEERKVGLYDKFINLSINYNFQKDFGIEFGGRVDDNKIFQLSFMYDHNVIKIKDHILWEQCNALITNINKGYIDVDDI